MRSLSLSPSAEGSAFSFSSSPCSQPNSPDICQGCPGLRSGVWTSQKTCPPTPTPTLFHVLANPFDLLIPPVYSALAVELKGVTSSFVVFPR